MRTDEEEEKKGGGVGKGWEGKEQKKWRMMRKRGGGSGERMEEAW